MYVRPKNLPSCGHSFCADCLKKFVEPSIDRQHDRERDRHSSRLMYSIKCPECKMTSSIGSSGVDGLKPNISIERAISNLHNASAANNARSPPPLIANENKLNSRGCDCSYNRAKSTVVCHHCSERFCPGCSYAHMESLKLEIGWIGSGVIQFHEKI